MLETDITMTLVAFHSDEFISCHNQNGSFFVLVATCATANMAFVWMPRF